MARVTNSAKAMRIYFALGDYLNIHRTLEAFAEDKGFHEAYPYLADCAKEVAFSMGGLVGRVVSLKDEAADASPMQTIRKDSI